jgi:hypothetical protein
VWPDIDASVLTSDAVPPTPTEVSFNALLTPLLMVLMMVAGDFFALSSATDNVRPSSSPNVWRIRNLTIAGIERMAGTTGCRQHRDLGIRQRSAIDRYLCSGHCRYRNGELQARCNGDYRREIKGFIARL